MIQNYTSIRIHLIWSTWDRTPLLTPDIEPDVHRLIASESRKMRSVVCAVGGTDDHVHLLVELPTTLTIAELAKQVKGGSSYVVNQNRISRSYFRWQGSYSAISVSESHAATLVEYIHRQRQHHARGTIISSFEPHPTAVVASRSAPDVRPAVPTKVGR